MTRTNVVIGAGSGMGEAVARRLVGKGPLVVADLNVDVVAALARELDGRAAPVTAVAVDVAVASSVVALAEQAATFGAVIHTAGLSPTMAESRRILEVNLIGTANVLDAFTPQASEGSVAVCFASVAGHTPVSAVVADAVRRLAIGDIEELLESEAQGLPRATAAYRFSKYGVLDLVRRRAPAWGERGARVLSLSPGIIETPMGRLEAERQPIMAQMVAVTPLRRTGVPTRSPRSSSSCALTVRRT